MFLKEVSNAHQACIYLIKKLRGKYSNNVKYYYNLKIMVFFLNML